MDADIELATLTSLLEFDEFEVVESSQDRREKIRRLTLVPKTVVGLCPHCHGSPMSGTFAMTRLSRTCRWVASEVELVVRLSQFQEKKTCQPRLL